MKKPFSNRQRPEQPKPSAQNTPEDLPGYPLYPDSEDIYRQEKEEEDIDPENPGHRKTTNERAGKTNEGGFRGGHSGEDLDVPGSELDDEQEDVGSEDEENNYYSLGGDDHNDLDERHDDEEADDDGEEDQDERDER